MSGPVAGGTLLTISGTNLGRSYDHVQRAVTVDGKPCDVIKEKYKISIQYVFLNLIQIFYVRRIRHISQ